MTDDREPEYSAATAREMIETALMTLWRIENQDTPGHDRPRRLLDQYAHDLAEKIRAHAAEREQAEERQHGFIDHETQLLTEYAAELANLIDPEVQS